ncbi:MAG: hypothetical protein C3F18_04855, partial [Nitrosomonadales bacterium]
MKLDSSSRRNGRNRLIAFDFSAHPSPLTPHRFKQGFTLVELLVALTIFAVMSIAAYRGLTTLLDARTR